MFASAYICALHFVATTHPTCVFLLLADDMHIIGFASVCYLFFCDYKRIWNIKTLSVTNKVCSLLSIGVKLIYIISSFFTPEFNFHILGVSMGSLPFVESFVSMHSRRPLTRSLAILCWQILKKLL